MKSNTTQWFTSLLVNSLLVYTALLMLFACKKDKPIEKEAEVEKVEVIAGADISAYPEISVTNPVFYDLDGMQKDFLEILKENGVNTIRLKLWVNPANSHASFAEVKAFSQTLKSKGFNIWLTLHYSDTWADPGHQAVPAQWGGLEFQALSDSVYNYTARVVKQIQPHFMQVGNEINSGLLHPHGHISDNLQQFKNLISTAITAVREHADNTDIILHYAGIAGAGNFYSKLAEQDYDIIGLSYYPIWHGKSLDELQSTMQQLSQQHNKRILIAETAYPFTLGWADWTNNIIGLEEQLIMPDFPATATGQKAFIESIKHISTKAVTKGMGFCYWGAEWIAWKGSEATDGSPWENQALFDFDNKALPVLKTFRLNE
jgi:arabinogalactan endo-1,4-beta-galactosidase